MTDPNRIDRVVLLGFMGSGKSTIGEALARRMSWTFIDFDVEIERREGASVQQIIANRGEGYFRDLEEGLTAATRGEEEVVLAPGGGWITAPGLLESIRSNTFSVWLDVSPEETVRRLRADSLDRPLMNHPDPVVPIREMMAERASLFGMADFRIPGDRRSVESVAFELEQILRGRRAAE